MSAQPAHTASASACLEKVLESVAFANAPRDQSFLRFVCTEELAGRGGELKETVIATRLFGRKSSYDPRVDSIVRVVASHVRKRLEQYYRDEGAADPYTIHLPRGGYQPVFQEALAAPEPSGAEPVPPPSPPAARRRRWRWLVPAILASVLAGVGIGYLLRSPAWKADRSSLVVIPFANLDGSEESERMADALSEDITTELARSSRLRVVARTTSLLFRKQGADVRTIGARLAVGVLLEGSVRRHGDQVRVTAQLIELQGGYHLWSEAFEGPSALLPGFQDRITQAVRRHLGDSGHPAPPNRALQSSAQEAYFQARFLLRKGTLGRQSALPLLEKAVALEPGYSAAWAALATGYSTMAFHVEGDPATATVKAKAAAGRALQLDPGSAEACVALANLAYARDRDWRAADSWFRRALAANPNYTRALAGYGLFLMTRGRTAEAVRHVRRAYDLDPLSSMAGNELAVVLWAAGQYREALDAAGRSLTMQPDFAPARLMKGLASCELGEYDRAAPELDRALAALGRIQVVLSTMGYCQARAGRRPEAEALLREIEAGGGLFHAAIVAAGLDDRPRALDLLGRALRAGETDATFFPSHPAFARLRREPAYRALLASVGL